MSGRQDPGGLATDIRPAGDVTPAGGREVDGTDDGGHHAAGLLRRGVRMLGVIAKRPAGAVGLTFVALTVGMAVFAPLLAPVDPNVQMAGPPLEGPTMAHPFGTDHYGRDVLSRTLYGARTSLTVALVAVTAGGVVGTMAGLLAGYYGRWVDGLVGRVSDVLLAYPGILLGVVVVAIMRPGITPAATAIAIRNVPLFARLIRANVLAERELPYIQALHSMGATDWRIMWRHIAPNTSGPIIAQTSVSIGQAVLILAALSFIGLGAQPPTPDWGVMLNESRAYMNRAPLLAVFPGLALAMLMIGCNFLADALRDVVQRGRGIR